MAATTDDVVTVIRELTKATDALRIQIERATGTGKRKDRVDDGSNKDDDGPTFDPSSALGKAEQAWRSYKRMREGIEDLKSEGSKDPFKLLGRLFGKGEAAEEGAEGAAGAGEAAGAAGGAAGGVGAAVAIVVEYVKALWKFKTAVERTTDSLIETQRKLADASPAMAAIFAQRDVQELLRERKRGDALADSAGYLVGAEQRRKDATLPIETEWQGVKNRFYGFFNDVEAGMAKQLNAMLGLKEEKGDQQAPLHQQLEAIAQANRDRIANERAKLDRVKQQADKARRF
jgi:hypothetical protein